MNDLDKDEGEEVIRHFCRWLVNQGVVFCHEDTDAESLQQYRLADIELHIKNFMES